MAVEDIYRAVMDFDDERVADLVRKEVEAGTDIKRILDQGLVAPLDTIGRQFSEGIVFVPEMLMAADAVKAGMEVVKPLLSTTGVRPVGTVVLGTVKGDLHDIGKNMVGMMLEGAGFRLLDAGVDVTAEGFVDAARETDADIVAMSALLTTSMPEMEKAVAAVCNANASRNLNTKVIVGGPPVNQEFAAKIGAHGYGEDAPAAARVARTLI